MVVFLIGRGSDPSSEELSALGSFALPSEDASYPLIEVPFHFLTRQFLCISHSENITSFLDFRLFFWGEKNTIIVLISRVFVCLILFC